MMEAVGQSVWWLGHSCESCLQISATNEQGEMVKITLALRTMMYLQAAKKEMECDMLSHLSTHQAEREIAKWKM